MIRSLTQIRADKAKALRAYHEAYELLEMEEQAAIQHKRNHCRHVRTKVRSDSYFEAGRMNGPLYWKEKVCVNCGKTVAILSETTVEKWVPA